MTQAHKPAPARQSPSTITVWALLLGLFLAVYGASLSTPPLLDDVDASHAQAAAHMAESGDLVTLQINGIRYLEKPPLPYWLVAASYRLFGQNALATHLPDALAILGLAWLAWLWASRAWGARAGLYAALGTLSTVGPFLYTRFFIPDSILSFFLLAALYCLLTGFEDLRPGRFYAAWSLLALAMLTKGLIAPVFFFAAAIPWLILSGQWRRWRQTRPISGLLLFLAIAAPWHILAGLRNPDQGHPVGNIPTPGNVHGFWYFYFLNEHLFRFLGTRFPHDYNRLPALWYWLGHLVWLFPWSLFIPAALIVAWRTRHSWLTHLRPDTGHTVDLYLDNALHPDPASYVRALKFRVRSAWLLALFAAFTLLFFSLSTNQEYYTWPAWVPILMLISGVLAQLEQAPESDQILPARSWLLAAHYAFAAIGLIATFALAWGLWISRAMPRVNDIGTVLAHRGVGDYTLSTSHLFDLTGASFAALRAPAIVAALALFFGPLAALVLRLRRRHQAATVTIALTGALFLVAAHIAFARFEPMLSSRPIADTLLQHASPADDLIVFGDQSDASSVIFYTHRFFGRPALLVHGNGSSLLWGSCYPDAPPIFWTEDQLSTLWGTGPRHWLFAQDTNRPKVEQLLAGRLYPVQTIADKTLWTDRPLN